MKTFQPGDFITVVERERNFFTTILGHSGITFVVAEARPVNDCLGCVGHPQIIKTTTGEYLSGMWFDEEIHYFEHTCDYLS